MCTSCNFGFHGVTSFHLKKNRVLFSRCRLHFIRLHHRLPIFLQHRLPPPVALPLYPFPTQAKMSPGPYSSFRVGAAFLATDWTIVTGANVENASFPVGTCAERCALAKGVVSDISFFLLFFLGYARQVNSWSKGRGRKRGRVFGIRGEVQNEWFEGVA